MPHAPRASSARSMSGRPSTSSIVFGRSAVSWPMREPLPDERMRARDGDMMNAPQIDVHDCRRGALSGRPGQAESPPLRDCFHLYAADKKRLHGEDDDERGDGADCPDLGERRKLADHRLEDQQVREERALDQLP